MITLDGRVILLTGASKGIGAATADRLLAAGADVLLHYNTAPGHTAELVERHGAERCTAIQADLGSAEEVDRLWADALAWRGHLDGLVNNAAVMLSAAPDDPMEAWRADWQRTLAVNVAAVADLCRHAVAHFQQRGGGTVVNIASRAAFRGDLPDAMHYAASKGAVVALTRSLAKAYAADDILAYAVAPGWVGTDRIRAKLDQPGNQRLLADVPIGDAAPPEEVGNIVAFLMSGLARHATGATVDINGASYFH